MAKSHPRPRARSSRQRSPKTGATARSGAAASEWLTGFHSVREALLAGRRRFDRLWLRAGQQREEQVEVAKLARTRGVLVELVDAAELADRIEQDGNHQGLALRAGPIPELSLRQLLELVGSVPEGHRRLVALDGVEDPQNVGAVARVAESSGVGGLILTDRRAPPLTPAVSRASAGAIEWLPVARVSNLVRALAQVKDSGYWVVAAGFGPKSGLYELDDRILTGNLTVVLGAEGRGIRRSILEQADHLIEIPMRGRISSLNVSTAGAIILYDLLRRSESIESATDQLRDGAG